MFVSWFASTLSPYLPSPWVVLTFFIGVAAGLQLLLTRFPGDSSIAWSSFPSLLYLFIRGLIPAALFCIQDKTHIIAVSPAISAIAIGFGSEAALRSRILLSFKSSGPGQTPAENSKGLLDFVSWAQDFVLKKSDDALCNRRVKIVKRWYWDSKLNFGQICERLKAHLGALGDETEPRRKDAAKILTVSKAEYEVLVKKAAAQVPPVPLSDEIQRQLRMKLGYTFYNKLGRNSFDTLSNQLKG